MGGHEPRRPASLALRLSEEPRPHPPRALHGRRVGRPLRKEQRARYEQSLPEFVAPLASLAHPVALFARPLSEIRMEIGFGGGEHLAAEAERLPNVGFIGCEPFLNGVAKLLDLIGALRLENVRIHPGDAAAALDSLPDAALAQVDLLYPDPWPKRRQHKRRFVSHANLERLARAMRVGAELRFATDIDGYAGWTLAHVLQSPWFTWSPGSAEDWRRPWQPWCATRYEAKAVRDGRVQAYLTFVRTAVAAGQATA